VRAHLQHGSSDLRSSARRRRKDLARYATPKIIVSTRTNYVAIVVVVVIIKY